MISNIDPNPVSLHGGNAGRVVFACVIRYGFVLHLSRSAPANCSMRSDRSIRSSVCNVETTVCGAYFCIFHDILMHKSASATWLIMVISNPFSL